MSECRAVTDNMPLLLTESLDRSRRELAHQHIESCDVCGAEWAAWRETWTVLGELPEVEVPVRVRDRFLATIEAPKAAKVVPFRTRTASKWLAQAAAVVVVAGGAYFAGNRTAPRFTPVDRPAITGVQPLQPYSIAETRVLAASQISPDIEGRPSIQNVQFTEVGKDEVGVSFDVTSRVTVTGNPSDRSMVRLLSYVLESDKSITPSRSRAMDWVRQTYSDPAYADPEIASALAKVLRNDEHEGVRIRAAETLMGLPAAMGTQTREALIDALKSDPNPAVRIKAVEALAKFAASGGTFDTVVVDTLRQKASQDDENLYVRAKAAEVLGNIQPQ